MIPKSHPYWHVRSIVQKTPQIATLALSYYTYSRQSVDDIRQTWQVSSSEFCNEAHIEAIQSETPRGQELALHSNVMLTTSERQHLVMVDMSTTARAHLDKLLVFLGDHFSQQIAWFSSGRSYHGYGERLLSETDWVKFMGLLLLANKPRLEPTVDPRWIGHRLLAGYSALRWTLNTSHYLLLPTRLEQSRLGGRSSIDVAALARSMRR